MPDTYNLDRFLEAQEGSYNTAYEEIKKGRKISHWMWFIFPQLRGLGNSETSKKYAIQSKDEAIAYYNHPVLGSRLIEITKVLLKIEGKSAHDIFGSPDDVKLKSCMTLFSLVQKENDLFNRVLLKYFEGKKSWKTIELLNTNGTA